MRFSPQTLAALELCWLTTPATPSVCFHGHDGSLCVSVTEWRCLDTAGAVRDSGTCAGPDPLEASIGEFLRSVESADRPAPLQPEARLAVLATIDAAYLSARTGEPVSPGRIFTMQGLRPERPAEPPKDAAADEPPV
jgi:predicted dehydrogenase